MIIKSADNARTQPTKGKKPQVEMFDRDKGGWGDVKLRNNSVSFDLGPGLGELLRITGVESPWSTYGQGREDLVTRLSKVH